VPLFFKTAVMKVLVMVGTLLFLPELPIENSPASRSARIHGPLPAPVPQAVIELKLRASIEPGPTYFRESSLLP